LCGNNTDIRLNFLHEKKLLLIFLSFTFFAQISAQTPACTYVITADTALQQFLDNKYWQVLNDKNGKFTINDVQKEPLASQFCYFTKNSNDRFTRTTWFRFNLKNNAGKNLAISIAADATEADFYIPDSTGMMHHFLTGREVAWHNKDGFKKNNAIPFEIKQGEQITIYLKTVNRFAFLSTTLKFSLFNTEKLEKSILKDYQDNYFNSVASPSLVLCGIFLLAAILNLLLFFTVRGKTYLYFSLFSLCATLSYGQPLYDVTHVNQSLSWIIGFISVLWEFFLFQFVRHYLQVSAYHPRWNKWLLIILSLFLTSIGVAIFITAVSPHYFFSSSILIFVGETAAIITIIFWLSFIITIIIFSLKRTGQIKVFLIGILPFLLDTLFFTLLGIIALFNPSFRNTLNSYSNFNGYVNGVCLLWMAAVISWDLFKQYAFQEKRITQEKLEKEQLANEKEIQKNELIAQQKIELEKQVIERTSELKQSLEELKSTQSQLIQSEKMASMGELTAGIAHEIQNPLNFVNNFSDVNKELLQELKEEADKGNIDEVRAIANDVIENEEKINHHGKRADAIVKGMLEHSRTNSGVREPTDINALCDEYLRLSYHGLRAKDKSFNAKFETDFDMAIGKINIVPQDVGRVILNLINNAFYAVNEKKKSTLEGYEPIVSISTKKINGKAEVRVTDNGNGIPQNIVDKIFQPFFTTKPTGQGTGLGLSLSYDIIKAHNGELNVETKEKKGSTFVIQLPTT
jgi:two-component system NtrC family sensor kinase